MGYKFPSSSVGTAGTSNGAYQLSGLYSPYAVSQQYPPYNSRNQSRYSNSQRNSNGSSYAGQGQLSLSSSSSELCGYCRKPHVPNSKTMVNDIRTHHSISTCSKECQTALLKNMMAKESSTNSGQSGTVSMPVVRSAAQTNSYNSGSQAYSSHGSTQYNQSQYTGGANGSNSTRWSQAQQTSSFPPNTSSHVTSHHSQYPSMAPQNSNQYASAQGNTTYGSTSAPYTSQSPQFSNQSALHHHQQHHGSYSAPAKAHGSQQKAHGSWPEQPRSAASKQYQAPPQKATVQVSVNSLDLQLQKWLDQRQNLPPLWGVKTIVLDTNVLLDESNPDVLHDLHRMAPDLTFIVPYVLVQELDSLKNRLSGPKYAARQAISRLHDMLVISTKKEKWVRGQKAEERLPLEGTLQTTSGDDRILECVNYFHTYSPPGKRVMLLTHDKNLQLKTSILGMLTAGVSQYKTFFEGFKWLMEERTTLKTLLASARVTSNTESLKIPDWKLEDYQPQDDEEEDEFAKNKRQADADAAHNAEVQAKIDQAALEAAKQAALRADALARLPEGTRTDLYDESSVESPTSTPRSDTQRNNGSSHFTKDNNGVVSKAAHSDAEQSDSASVSSRTSDKAAKKKEKNKKRRQEKKQKQKLAMDGEKKNKKKRTREEGEKDEDSEPPKTKKTGLNHEVILID